MKVNFSSILSDTAILTEKFLAGDSFTIELSTTVLDTIDRKDTTPYQEVLNKVKKILDKAKKETHYNIIMFASDFSLTLKEKAVFIRMVNLGGKHKEHFILLNGEIIYQDPSFNNYHEQEILTYLAGAIKSINRKKRIIKINNLFQKVLKPFHKQNDKFVPKVIRSNRKPQTT